MAGVLVGTVVASASTGTPEIDRANATIKFSGQLNPVSCVGEDAVKYVTFIGAWRGNVNQLPPDPTDYPFTGPFTVSAIQWTINAHTLRGVLTGQISILAPTGAPAYKGRLTLVTQGLPNAAGAQVSARGWISAVAQPPDEGATPNDDSLIANVEFLIGPAGGSGQFGDVPASLGIKDFSVVTNVAPLAQDGVC
jgi:hypothetical protein